MNLATQKQKTPEESIGIMRKTTIFQFIGYFYQQVDGVDMVPPS